MNNKSRFLHGQSIQPPAIDANISIADLIDKTFNAYNAARFREACHLFSERILADDVTIGLQKNIVLKKDVVNADDAFFAEHAIVEVGQAATHFEADAEVGVVVEIRSCR